MRSIDDNKANPIIDSDTETQSPSPSQSSSSSGEELKDLIADEETIPLGGETQLLDFDEETQKLDYLEYEDENVRTQLLDASDGEGTDKTEILSDGGGGGGSVDQQGGEVDYVDDSDASTGTAHNHHSGSVRKSFMSVPAASLQGSEQPAARSVSTKETNEEADSFAGNFISGKKHLDHENEGGSKDPVSVGIEVETDSNNNVQNCDNNTTVYNDKTQCGGANSTAQKLFDEDASTGNIGVVNDNDCYDGSRELPESPAYAHKFAGLSYVGSQEPGEFSQANALGFVDNFLAVNDVGLSQEGGCGKILKELSPPVSRAKVTQSLAKNSVIKSPVRDVKIYDWDDSYIDKGVRGFSDGSKGTSNKSRCIGPRSLGQPQKSRYTNSSKGRGASNKPSGKNKSYSKTMDSTCSDSRATLGNPKHHDKMMQTSETSIMKNLSDDLDEPLNVEPQGNPLEGTGIGMDLTGAYDVGFDTQVAVEAMEALCHGVPPIRDTETFYQVSENVTCGSPRARKNNEELRKSKNNRKRVSSDSGGTTRQSKRTREVVTEVNNLKGPETREPRLAMVVKKKLKPAKSKAEEHRSNGISMYGKQDMSYGSFESVRHRKTRSATEMLQNKGSDRCDSLNMLNATHEVSERRVGDDSGSKPSERNKSYSKAMNSTCSDTRALLGNSKQHDKMKQTYEISNMKNLSDDSDELLNVEPEAKSLEGTGIGLDLPGAYDIGFDTQVAAEAMEALCVVPPIRDTENCYQVSENATCGSPRAGKNNEVLTKSADVRKRVSSISEGTIRQSKRTSKVVTEVNNFLSRKELKAPEMREPRPATAVRKKLESAKSKAEEHRNNGISVDGKEDMDYGSYESVKHSKTRAATEKLHNKVSDRRDSLNMSNANHEVSERRVQDDYGSFTPIACRTRQSKAMKPLTGLDFSNKSGSTNDLVQTSICVAKRRSYSSGVDAPGTLTTKGKSNQSGSNQISRARKRKLIQLESPGNDGPLESGATNEKCDFLSYSRGKRTCRNQSGIKGSDLDGLPVIAVGENVHEQYIPRRKRSKIDARGSARSKFSTEKGRRVDAITRSSPDGAEGNSMLRIIPGDEVKPSNAASVTLVNRSHAIEMSSPTLLGQKSTSKAAPIPASKELRKKRDMADIRVLLSQHLDVDIIKQQKKISSRLGISIAPSSSESTHFIADKFVRTRNMLEVIALGKPVVTHLWLESCGKANCFVDETNYILRDSEKEKEIGFSMPVSLARARACHGQLLQGKRIFITPNVKPSRELVASLVTSVHGQVVKRIGSSAMKDDKVVEDLLVLSCEEDYATCVPLLLKKAAVYSSELLLNGIVIQKLEYERHRLFKDHVKRSDRATRTR